MCQRCVRLGIMTQEELGSGVELSYEVKDARLTAALEAGITTEEELMMEVLAQKMAEAAIEAGAALAEEPSAESDPAPDHGPLVEEVPVDPDSDLSREEQAADLLTAQLLMGALANGVRPEVMQRRIGEIADMFKARSGQE